MFFKAHNYLMSIILEFCYHESAPWIFHLYYVPKGLEFPTKAFNHETKINSWNISEW